MIIEANRSALLLGATLLAGACSGKAERAPNDGARGGAAAATRGGRGSGSGSGGVSMSASGAHAGGSATAGARGAGETGGTGIGETGGGTGIGETGGAGGAAGAGETGGSAGACGPQLPPVSFDCETPTFVAGTSTCGEAATREALGCGMPGSQYDANCCARPHCGSDAECGPEALCIPRSIQAPGAQGSETESCALCDGTCTCGVTADIDASGRCIARTERVADFLCNVGEADCRTLEEWAGEILDVGDVSDVGSDDVVNGVASTYALRVVSCRETLLELLAVRCGVKPACDCDTQSEPNCVMKLADFSPFASRVGAPVWFEKMRRNAKLLVATSSFDVATYSECDDGTRRFHFEAEGANRYDFVFGSTHQGLLYGSASGLVRNICEPAQTNGMATIQAGAPFAVATCRTCSFAARQSDQFGSAGAGGTGENPDPACAYDYSEAVKLPQAW